MRFVSIAIMVLLLAGPLAGCDKVAEKKVVSQAEVAKVVAGAGKENILLNAESVRTAMDKAGCNIVFANGIGGSDPHVIVAGDKTPGNDAARYYNGLAAKDRKAIEDVVYQRAWQSFVCVGSCEAKKSCAKDVRITYGSGHLPKLGKDVYIVQAERSCQCR